MVESTATLTTKSPSSSLLPPPSYLLLPPPANQAFLALQAAQMGLTPEVYEQYAKSQIYYMLGDCCIDPETKEVREEEGHGRGGEGRRREGGGFLTDLLFLPFP